MTFHLKLHYKANQVTWSIKKTAAKALAYIHFAEAAQKRFEVKPDEKITVETLHYTLTESKHYFILKDDPVLIAEVLANPLLDFILINHKVANDQHVFGNKYKDKDEDRNDFDENEHKDDKPGKQIQFERQQYYLQSQLLKSALHELPYTFSGDKNDKEAVQNINHFRIKMENAIKPYENQITIHTKCMLLQKNKYITGSAYEHIQDKLKDTKLSGKALYEHIWATLVERYEQPCMYADYKTEYETAKQGIDESIRDYLDRFDKLVNSYKMEIKIQNKVKKVVPELTSIIIAEQCQVGIKESLRNELIERLEIKYDHENVTYEELVLCLKQFIKSRKRKEIIARKAGKINPTQYDTNINNIYNYNSNQNRRPWRGRNRGRGRNNYQQANRPGPGYACDYCGSNAHWKQYCNQSNSNNYRSTRFNNSTRGSRGSNNRRNNNNNNNCFKCGKSGHWARDCKDTRGGNDAGNRNKCNYGIECTYGLNCRSYHSQKEKEYFKLKQQHKTIQQIEKNTETLDKGSTEPAVPAAENAGF